mgnify:CR=1 FL=1
MDHTLIIPTKNRPTWLYFSFNCLEKFGYKGKIIVVDGSDEAEHVLNKQNFEKFKQSFNLEVIREVHDEKIKYTRINISKYNIFKNKIKTRFYSVMNDDDLFLPDFAEYGIKFLENNPDFSAITGIEINNFINNKFKITKSFTKIFPEYLQSDPLDRILHYSTDQNQSLPIFGVCRTSIMKELFEFENEYNFKPFCREKNDGLYSYDQEMPWQLHILINGKIKVSSSHLMNIRNRHDSPTRDSNLRFQKNHIAYRGPLELIINNSLGDFVREHLLELTYLIKNKSKYDDEIVRKVLNRIIWKFISREKGSGLHTEETDYNTELKKYRKDFKKIIISFPKISKILSKNFLLQICNKFRKFGINIKIYMLAKQKCLIYKNLFENFKKF